jgi:hypothetical protein
MAKRKVTVETDNSNWQAPKTRKTRKPRKPMSEEQRVAASERLAKAREKRAEANPDYGKAGLAVSIKDLPDDHRLHPDKVKVWIKTQKDLLKSEKAGIRAKVKGSEARAGIHEGYIKNMVKYLRDGDWVDDFYGEHQEHKITRRCIAQAYHWYGPKKGQPKFDVGVYYPMLGCIYTKEMQQEEFSEERESRNERINRRTRRK